MKNNLQKNDGCVLGVEGGGTKTVVLAANKNGELLKKQVFGPSNIRLISDTALLRLFQEIAAAFPAPDSIGFGLSGVRTDEDKEKLLKAVRPVWGDIPTFIGHDLEIALWAAPEVRAGKQTSDARVVVLSGTGSCCFGRAGDSRSAKVGGWGHLLGDLGSGYDISLSALKACVWELDRKGKWGVLGQKVLRFLLLNHPEQLIDWTQQASKTDVASLAPVVFEAAKEKDSVARSVLAKAAEGLATDASYCAKRLVSTKQKPLFIFAGSILSEQKKFAAAVAKKIRAEWPGAIFTTLNREGAWGAIELARRIQVTATTREPRLRKGAAPGAGYVPEFVPNASPTEQRNPRSENLHKMPVDEAVRLMLGEEARGVEALKAQAPQITKAVGWAVETLKRGGRIFYVGAGTSGRLGVLDASECPPTFSANPEMIQGIMAGGHRALWLPAEGAEDDYQAGFEAAVSRGVRRGDLVIGIAASGRTPFVWGALAFGKKTGARTVLVCFNPSLKIEAKQKPGLVIAPNLGPEILTGSTRLKSGTATKLILNTISTLAMVKLGKVVGNLMIDLNPSNVKLRDRAVRIVRELTGADAAQAKAALEKSQWVVKEAWQSVLKEQKSRK